MCRQEKDAQSSSLVQALAHDESRWQRVIAVDPIVYALRTTPDFGETAQSYQLIQQKNSFERLGVTSGLSGRPRESTRGQESDLKYIRKGYQVHGDEGRVATDTACIQPL